MVGQKYNKMSTPDRSKDTQEQLKEELAKLGHREAQGEGDSTLELGPRAWPYHSAHSPAGQPSSMPDSPYLSLYTCTVYGVGGEKR